MKTVRFQKGGRKLCFSDEVLKFVRIHGEVTVTKAKPRCGQTPKK